MAAFRIWCRTAPVGPDHYLATVCAIPAHREANPSPLESESRLFTCLRMAELECNVMAHVLKARLSSQGHSIIEVLPV